MHRIAVVAVLPLNAFDLAIPGLIFGGVEVDGGPAYDVRVCTAEPGILATLAEWERSLPFGRLRIDLTELYAAAVAQGEQLGSDIIEQAQNIAGVTIAALGSLLLIIVLSLYMLMDSRRILGRLRGAVPRRYTDEVKLLERSVSRAFGGFLRAQLILAVLQAVLVGVVGTAFGIPYLDVRALSDLAGKESRFDFAAFVHEVAGSSAMIARRSSDV